MDDRLGNLTILEHRLIGRLLVDHVDRSQQLILIELRLDRKLVQTHQHPLHLLLANRIFEGVERVLLLQVVETRSTLIVFVITSAVDVDGMQVVFESLGTEALQIAIDHVEQDDFLD